VAIVSYGFWQRRLNADLTVLSAGRNIMLDGVSTTIIGVLPPDFRIQFGQDEPEVWVSRPAVMPIMTPEQVRSGAGYLTYVVRLRPQVSIAQAQAELDSISARYKTEFASFADAPNNGLRIVDFNEDLVGDVRPSLLVLLAGVALVLLIACANVSHLLMARAAGRQKEIALRSALGASRKRLVRQLLTESLLLSLLGCGVGLFFSQACLKLLLAGGPKDIPRLYQANLDPPVLLFALAISLITAIVFGLAPAFHSARVDLNSVLKDQGRGSTAHGKSGTIRSLLTISETAIAVVLVVGSALLMETLVQLQSVKLGFEPANVLTGRLTLAPVAYREPQQRVAFTRALLDRLQHQPGVETVALSSYIPLAGSDFGFYFFVEGRPSLGMGKDPAINVRHISPRYFATLRIPVLQGRDFTDQDNQSTMPVAIVNEQTARRYWPGQSAIGKRLANSRNKIMREVVGVVGDSRFHGPSTKVMDELYLPYAQQPWPTVNVVMRTASSPQQLASVLRTEVAAADPNQPVARVSTMDELAADSTAQPRFTAWLSGSFAGLALILAAIGLYGLIAFSVSSRTAEIGIRMALGARRADVVQIFLRQSLRLSGIGIVLGLAFALAGSRLLSKLLYGVSATQPGVFVMAGVLFLLVTILASAVPAWRAARTEPAQALRGE
jgi:putative ABC transport system permease protein